MTVSEIHRDLVVARHRVMYRTGRDAVVTLYLGEKEKQEFLELMHAELPLFKRTESGPLIGNFNGFNVVPVAMPSYYRVETEIQWGS